MGAPRREQNRILLLSRLRSRKETDRFLQKGISKEDPSAKHKRTSTNSAKPREAEMKPLPVQWRHVTEGGPSQTAVL